MLLHLRRITFTHIFGYFWRVVLIVFRICNLVNWQSSEKRRMIIYLTMFYTMNLVNFFFFGCLFRLRNMAIINITWMKTKNWYRPTAEEWTMWFLAFPNGLLTSQSIGCNDARQSCNIRTFLCRAYQISRLVEKTADIFLKRENLFQK